MDVWLWGRNEEGTLIAGETQTNRGHVAGTRYLRLDGARRCARAGGLDVAGFELN
jgi:hypothetical protein